MNDTYCDVSFGEISEDVDQVAFCSTTDPVARKEHLCTECKDAILPGERYRRTAFKHEGTVATDRLCARCAEILPEFEWHILGGDFWRHMEEQWDQGANVQGCINRLTTAAAKAHMLRRWQRWKGIA